MLERIRVEGRTVIDQMPDEVWLRRIGTWVRYPEGEHRYIRADLCEQAGDFDHQGIDPADLGQHFADAMQALTARNAVSKASCAQLIAEQAQRAEQAEAERDAIRQQAEIWAQEARTQRATVHECYQACTGATGEPGDWHGAEPVRAVVAERDRLRAALKRIEFMPYRVDRPFRLMDASRAAREALDHD